MAAVFAIRTQRTARTAALLGRALSARVSPWRLLARCPGWPASERLVQSLPALIGGDAERGAELYAGNFDLAGSDASADGLSIFALAPPSRAWFRELHGFAWLADLRASDTALARAYGRALVEEWIARGCRKRGAQAPDTAARRILSWLENAPFLLADSEPAFRRAFARSLARQARRLYRDFGSAPAGTPRLSAAVAITATGLCLDERPAVTNAGRKLLGDELALQILPDGGHVSRNPAALIAVLRDLLPLRHLFALRQMEPPAGLLVAIDRLQPMLRFFRHGDGTLALFNGMGATQAALLSAIVAADDAQGRPVLNAGHSGYQRIEAGPALLIADAGLPPPPLFSTAAHAGTLSFEFSVGRERMIVNCGTPAGEGVEALKASRRTAAHSTVTIAEASSSRFARSDALNALVGGLPMVEGPEHVECVREDGPEATVLRLAHDGYSPRFGIVHQRRLKLAHDGSRLEGVERFRSVGSRKPSAQPFAVRFHLHPDVQAARTADGSSVILRLPSGMAWTFEAEGLSCEVEESILFSAAEGARHAEQIVVRGTTGDIERLAWSFSRTAPR